MPIDIVQSFERQTGSKMSHFLRLIPFMSPVGAHFTTQLSDSEEECIRHNKRLEAIVESCGFTVSTIAADGNCCFRVIAYSLIEQINTIKADFPSYFNTKSIPQHCTREELTQIIREMAVKEWLANTEEYQRYLTDSTVEDEAPKFLQQGYYYGELANSMILAISNALEIPYFHQHYTIPCYISLQDR